VGVRVPGVASSQPGIRVLAAEAPDYLNAEVVAEGHVNPRIRA